MPEVMQQPRDPEYLAREAGKNIYGTSVGMLRRAELWRLGNAWGMKFPDGCSKDFMLPFFKQLEAEGKDPLRPPSGSLMAVVTSREVQHSEENHAEVPTPEELLEVAAKYATPDTITPAPISEFEEKLRKTPHGLLKKMCKERGIKQERTDSTATLVQRILVHVQNPPGRSE